MPAPEAPGTQGAAGVEGAAGDVGDAGKVTPAATFGKALPAMQPGAAAAPAVAGEQGAARAAGVAANNARATKLPPKTKLERFTVMGVQWILRDRSVADMLRCPLQDRRRACLDAARHGGRDTNRDVARFAALIDHGSLLARVEHFINARRL